MVASKAVSVTVIVVVVVVDSGFVVFVEAARMVNKELTLVTDCMDMVVCRLVGEKGISQMDVVGVVGAVIGVMGVREGGDVREDVHEGEGGRKVGVVVVQGLLVAVEDGHDDNFGGTYGGVRVRCDWGRTHPGRSFFLHLVDGGACRCGSCVVADAVVGTCRGYMGLGSGLLARGCVSRRHA